jgi:hypothetical protein
MAKIFSKPARGTRLQRSGRLHALIHVAQVIFLAEVDVLLVCHIIILQLILLRLHLFDIVTLLIMSVRLAPPRISSISSTVPFRGAIDVAGREGRSPWGQRTLPAAGV